MSDTYDLRIAEAHIEVHKFRGGTIAAATIVALFLQTAVPFIFQSSRSRLPCFLPSISASAGVTLERSAARMVIGFTGQFEWPTIPWVCTASQNDRGYLPRRLRKAGHRHPIARFALTIIFFGVHQA